MSIFYRHDIIYESMTTGWYEIAESDPGWDQAYSPPLVPARKVPPSSAAFVDEVVVISTEAPGWDQAFLPPLVPSRPDIFLSITEEVLDEVPIGGGAGNSANVLVFDFPIIYQAITLTPEAPEQDPGWDQAYLPPVVPPIKVPFSSVVIVQEVPLIQTGWDQTFLPPLVLPLKVPPSSTVFTDEVAPPLFGGEEPAAPIIVLRVPVITPRDLTTVFQFVAALGDEAFSPAPPIVLARANPASSSTFIELDDGDVVVVVKLQLLGGGILQRKQMG